MGVEHFMIRLDNDSDHSNSGPFSPGQVIQGKVEFHCTSNETVLGLYISCSGKAIVHWLEPQHVVVRRKASLQTADFDNTEQYFNYGFWPFGNGQDQMTINVGQYEYPFEFALPPDIPSSWLGEHGSVAYKIEAVLKNKRTLDNTSVFPFEVIANVDLNFNPEAATEGADTGETMVGSGCCKKPIVLSFKIPKKGYVPGEGIPFELLLQNKSKKEIENLEISFVQLSIFNAGGKTKESYNDLIKMEREKIPARTDDTWNNCIPVPDLPPTNLGNCKIIEVRYFMRIIAHISGGGGPEAFIGLTIGTIPIGNSRTAESEDQKTDEAEIHPNAGPRRPTKSKKKWKRKSRKTEPELEAE